MTATETKIDTHFFTRRCAYEVGEMNRETSQVNLMWHEAYA